MSIQLQIAIPLFVTVAILTTIAILRKYLRPEPIIVCLVALGLGIYAVTLPEITPIRTGITSEDPVEEGKVESKAVSLLLAERYMVNGQYDVASGILSDLQKYNGNDPEVILASARCSLLGQNYAESVLLYNQLGEDMLPKEELAHASALLAGKSFGNATMVNYLTSAGKNAADYGFIAEEHASAGDYTSASKLVCEALDANWKAAEERYGTESLSAITYAANLTSSFASFVDEVPDESGKTPKKALSQLETALEENPALKENPHIRTAYLKGCVMTGNFGKIAKFADENTTPDELVILSELYTNDLIKESDFSEEYKGLTAAQYSEVLKVCNETLTAKKDELSKDDYAEYESKLTNLEDQLKHPAIFNLRQDLIDDAEDSTGNLQSKSYMALAKLEQNSGNEELADKYISEALGTAGNSDDDEYRNAMGELTGIIQGNSEAEEIKNVAKYVDTALDHSLPLEITSSAISENASGNGGASGENGDPNGNNGNSTSSSLNEEMKDHMTGTITEATAKINIGIINKDNFPEVKARVQIDSSDYGTIEEIKEHLHVYDCGNKISDFTLEPLTFSKSQIILLCDVSGSMSGSTEGLKDVIVSFASKMVEKEEVAVIGFDNSIKFSHPFSDDKNTVISYADSIGAFGGTALFSSLLFAGEQLSDDIDVNNVIIAMTDGQDGDSPSLTQMANDIGKMAEEKGITVYTIGLGDVNAEYLQNMAAFGNGNFLYSEDTEGLETFYSFIHGQLSNQYVLTYKAKNTTLNDRWLELSIDGEIAKAKKNYCLIEKEVSDDSPDAYNPYTVVDAELAVNGLSTKFLYKSSKTQSLKLVGSGFDAGDDITVRLVGNVSYELKATFIDSSSYTIDVPASIAVGTYDLEVTVRDYGCSLKKELTVATKLDEKEFKYGAYHFTALESTKDDAGNTVLSGNVTMNGWLHFKGDVTISAPEHSSVATVTDNSGAYISYDPVSANGLAKTLADCGIPVSFGSLGSFNIYPDAYKGGAQENFPVSEIEYLRALNLKNFFIENFAIRIYPDAIKFIGPNFTYKLPFQEHLMRNFKIGGNYSGKANLDGVFEASNIGLVTDVEYEDSTEYDFDLVSLPLKLTGFKAHIDTMKNEYNFEGTVKFKSIASMEGLAFGMGWKNNKIDSILLKTEGPEITLMEAPIPVSIGDFGYEIKDLSETDAPTDSDFLNAVLTKTHTVYFKVNVANLAKYMPKISKFIGKDDAALATLKDCTASLNLKKFRFAFDADMVLCELFELGKVHLALGNFEYTNALIGYYNEEVCGLQAKLILGNEWKSGDLSAKLELSGEVTVGYPYSGIWEHGEMVLDIGWWIFKKDVDISGDLFFGTFINSNDAPQLSFIAKGTNSKNKNVGLQINVTKEKGFKLSFY